MLDRLRHEQFDVLVIGGGITGVGTALDAASRGLKTALVERHDFASGTSSKSSKLIHGGLRYLQQGDVRLVYEGLAERQQLRHNAPHLVRILPFMIPILTRDGVMNAKLARAFGSALWMYDLTGGVRIGKLHRRLKKDAALAHMPTLPAERLASAYLYYDAQADDARLCLTVARTAAEHGAAVLNGADGRRPAQGTRPGHRRAGRRGRRRGGRRRDRCRERRGGLGRRGPRPRRGHQSRLHPAGQGGPPHRPVGEGAQRHRRRDPGPEGQAQPVRRAVGRLHLRGHHRHGLRRPHRRPAVHPGGPRVRAAGAERVRVDRCDRGRRDRHVGRPASARQERAVRPHGRPLAPRTRWPSRPPGW